MKERGNAGIGAILLVAMIIVGWIGYTLVTQPPNTSHVNQFQSQNTYEANAPDSNESQENNTVITNDTEENNASAETSNNTTNQQTAQFNQTSEEKCLQGHVYYKNISVDVASAYNDSGEVQIVDSFNSDLQLPSLNVQAFGRITQRRVSQWHQWYILFTRSDKDVLYHDIAIEGNAWDSDSWIQLLYRYENGTEVLYNLTGPDRTFSVHLNLLNPHPGEPYFTEVWIRYFFNKQGTVKIISTEKFLPVDESHLWGMVYSANYTPPDSVHKAKKKLTINVYRAAGNTNESCIGTVYVPLYNESYNTPLPNDGRWCIINITSGVRYSAPLCWPASGASVSTDVYFYLDTLKVMPKAYLDELVLTVVDDAGNVVAQTVIVQDNTVIHRYIYWTANPESTYTIYVSGVVYGIDDIHKAVYAEFTEYWI